MLLIEDIQRICPLATADYQDTKEDSDSEEPALEPALASIYRELISFRLTGIW